jgi:hypothetical protein
MKKVDPTFTTVKKTICPFCSFGCEFGVVFDDFGVRGVEYIADGSSQGRLCPRGSAAAFYLNHKLRSSMPTQNGKVLDWAKLGKDLKKIFDKPDNIAVTFDRNLTIEDYHSILGFCKTHKIDNIASTYLEPEFLLRTYLENTFSVDNINKAKTILVIGDPFNQAPMLSKSIIGWKLNDRKNRLVVLDTIATHTSNFASDFLRCNINTEPLALMGLAQENISGVDIAGTTGLEPSRLDDISKSLKQDDNGLILVCLSYGHTCDPQFMVEALERLSSNTNNRIIPFVEFPGFEGNQYFGEIIEKIKKKKIKYLFNFGELFPFYYPQFSNILKSVKVYATSPIKQNKYTVLPIALNLEKHGTILTNRGKQALSGMIAPASGARTVDEILSMVGSTGPDKNVLTVPGSKVNVSERAKNIAAKSKKSKNKKTVMLVGEKIAYNFLGLFGDEKAKINPLDAETLGIRANDLVSMRSKYAKVDFSAKLTTDVDPGVVVIAPETPEARGLFEYELNDNIVTFIPTEVEIWRKG